MKLKYKDFEFTVNPDSIEFTSSTNCKSKSVFGSNSVCENISVNPVVVTGGGAFYGDKGAEHCAVLQNMLKSHQSGWLFIPSFPPIKAFFTEFKFSKSSRKNAASYTFKFTEDCDDRNPVKKITYTFALKNENAFEIANRCNACVDDIMRLNDLKSPFDIAEGDKVVFG